MQDALDITCMDVWRRIALTDVTVWYNLIRVVPGLYSRRDREELMNAGCSVEVSALGTFTMLDGLPHSDHGCPPSCRYVDGKIKYHKRGQLHRRGGPAYLLPDGTTKYYEEGLLHRDPEEGPAMEKKGCYSEYIYKGRFHRNPRDGPAVINRNGYGEFYFGGRFHRFDDDLRDEEAERCFERDITKIYCIFHEGGSTEYWPQHSHDYGKEDVIQWDPNPHVAEGVRRTSAYYWNGKLHRDPKEGPAATYDDGSVEYYWKGELHRDPEDGPASRGPNHSEYYENGIFLRGTPPPEIERENVLPLDEEDFEDWLTSSR